MQNTKEAIIPEDSYVENHPTDHGFYTGQTKDKTSKVPHGQGILTYEDGAVYEGKWKDGKKHGEGILTCQSGEKYKGKWKDDKMDGEGILTYADGNVYKGEWKDGKRDGKGKVTYASGNKYEGEFKDGTIYINAVKQKKRNDCDTLLLESEQMHDENGLFSYEKDKFLQGGKDVITAVVKNSKEALDKLQAFLDAHKEKHTEKIRLVLDQHGGFGGANDIEIDTETAKEMLTKIADAGYKKAIISDLSCHGSMQHYFTEDVIQKSNLNFVKMHYAEEDRICIAALKGSDDNLRYSQQTLGKDGNAMRRKEKVISNGGVSKTLCL